jgi:hypothetical protein
VEASRLYALELFHLKNSSELLLKPSAKSLKSHCTLLTFADE